MRPTLNDIERAIRANFIINPEGGKFLEADIVYERDMKGAARIVFVGVAAGLQFRNQEICTYIDMSPFEFTSKLKQFKELYERGESMMRKEGMKCYDDAVDKNIRIYRKTNLVRNYLNSLQLYARIKDKAAGEQDTCTPR